MNEPAVAFMVFNYAVKVTQVLPIILILIDVGASAVYAYNGDYKRAVYWISAGLLTTTVTF
jgi:hypothetical protein